MLKEKENEYTTEKPKICTIQSFVGEIWQSLGYSVYASQNMLTQNYSLVTIHN